jgi:hypothetical protein
MEKSKKGSMDGEKFLRERGPEHHEEAHKWGGENAATHTTTTTATTTGSLGSQGRT